MTRHSSRIAPTLLAALAALAALAVLLAGCGQGARPHAIAESPSPRGTSSRDKPQTEQQAVNAIGLTQGNVPDHYKTTNVMPSGDVVAGQVTLDMCGADFRSEGLRVARHQVAFPAKDHRSSVSTETVAYSAGGAALAMREVRRAIATCPRGLVASHVQGMPLLRQRFTRLPTKPGWEPGTIADRVTETPNTGKSSSGIIIYQRHGNILNGIYVWGTGPEALRVAERCASLMADELDAAPAAAVNNA